MEQQLGNRLVKSSGMYKAHTYDIVLFCFALGTVAGICGLGASAV